MVITNLYIPGGGRWRFRNKHAAGADRQTTIGNLEIESNCRRNLPGIARLRGLHEEGRCLNPAEALEVHVVEQVRDVGTDRHAKTCPLPVEPTRAEARAGTLDLIGPELDGLRKIEAGLKETRTIQSVLGDARWSVVPRRIEIVVDTSQVGVRATRTPVEDSGHVDVPWEPDAR